MRLLSVIFGLLWLLSLATFAAHAELIAHWPMDEGQGDIIVDVVGQGGDGTLNGSPAWVETPHGMGLEFTDGQFAEIPFTPELEPASITVAAWVLFHSLATRQDFISKNDTYALSFQPGRGINAVIMTGNDWVDLAAPASIEEEVWYHAALVFDEDSTQLQVYIDGELQAEEETPTPIEYDRGNSGALTLGTYENRFLQGILDEVRIYNEALSQAQIADIMQSAAAVDPTGKLTATWAGLKALP